MDRMMLKVKNEDISRILSSYIPHSKQWKHSNTEYEITELTIHSKAKLQG